MFTRPRIITAVIEHEHGIYERAGAPTPALFVCRRMKIVFMGTPAAAVPTLERLIADGHEVAAVYTQPDRPAGRGKKLTPPPVKVFAAERGLKILQPMKLKTEEAAQEFAGHKADAAIVVAYGRILPDAFLNVCPRGAINVHFSLLPKYRGAAPVNWAIVNGEGVTGVSTMQMDAGLDTGDILLQRALDIGPHENSIELMERLAVVGADLLSETLGRLDEIGPIPQNHADATLAPILRKGDGLVDWTMKATAIANRVRGFQPFPGVFTFFRGKRVKILKARPLDTEASHSETAPGSILKVEDGYAVNCGGGGTLLLETLQPEGKQPMSAESYFNGVRPTEGEGFFSENV